MPPTSAGRPPRTAEWPRWVGLAALTAAVASLPLILLAPLLAVLLAVVALVVSLAGAGAHSGPVRREYQAASALAVGSLVLLAVASITLLRVLGD